MALIVDALINLSKRHLTDENGWYSWPTGKLPSGIVLKDGAGYHGQVELKKALNKMWAEQPDRRAELERYYVVEFGGVRGNRATTMAGYAATLDPLVFQARGAAGIATWSKILTARDAGAFAIYDARVAVALNALQLVMKVAEPIFFPHLPSKNKMIGNGQKLLRKACSEWPRFNRNEFYGHYLDILRGCAARMSVDFAYIGIETFEMLLFSFAEDLLDEAFPNDAATLRMGYVRAKRMPVSPRSPSPPDAAASSVDP